MQNGDEYYALRVGPTSIISSAVHQFSMFRNLERRQEIYEQQLVSQCHQE
jgi:hypothetical protein